VFLNFWEDDQQFSEFQLGDLAGCYLVDSEWAKSGTMVGAPMWSSPKIHFEMPGNTATDMRSFGTLVCIRSFAIQPFTPCIMKAFADSMPSKHISLIYGGNFNLFRPKHIDREYEEYILGVDKRHSSFFAPFPARYVEIASPETVQSILKLMQMIPKADTTPFHRTTERGVIKKDNDFICKIMKLDWRDGPTAKQLLEDKWWDDDGPYLG
jgi:hypothetical protein